jgi:hypothetical protein
MNLAIEKGEAIRRTGTVSAYVGREPTRTWIKSGFVRALVQSGATRYPSCRDPTIYELLNPIRPPTPPSVTKVMLSTSGDLGRPFFAPRTAEASKFARVICQNHERPRAPRRSQKTRLGHRLPLGGEELEKLQRNIRFSRPRSSSG